MPTPQDKVQFDKQMLDVYLTGLQAEVEAKLRAVTRFRENMRRLDEVGGGLDRGERRKAARLLVKQIEEMLETNRVVRETLRELKAAAQSLASDLDISSDATDTETR
jgi:hypothetical protein